jgi:hypothetical protein
MRKAGLAPVSPKITKEESGHTMSRGKPGNRNDSLSAQNLGFARWYRKMAVLVQNAALVPR